jgi:hypothetical protein
MALAEPRWYVGLATLKDELGLSAASTTHDAKLKRYIARASAYAETVSSRVFYPVTATRYFDVPTKTRSLFLRDDLLSVTSLSDDQGAKAASDYFLYPLNQTPHTRVELLLSNEAWYYDDSPQKAVVIVGDWGYCADYEATTTLSAAITTTTATTFTATDGTLLEVGNTLLIDSERLFVSGISSSTITVQRGVNGSTAATHLISTAIYRYVPPADIVEAVVMLAGCWYAWRSAGGIQSQTIGNYSVSYVNGWPVPDTAQSALEGYRRPVYS